MKAVPRRSVLKLGAAGVLGPAATFALPFAAGCSESGRDDTVPDPAEVPAVPVTFVHGVASGDPLPEAVILWTRITRDDGAAEGLAVTWEVARDTAFAQVVKKGRVDTGPDRDFTVKVDATGLEAATTYFYRFRVAKLASPVGRTRTAPAMGAAVDRLRFAVVSCSSLAHGYFHAYRSVAQRLDLDAVIHLGDYIYEYGSGHYGSLRAYEPPGECLTLADYRTRFAQYRKDADLQEVHRQHPFIAVWDDHEVANDAYRSGAENHQMDEGPYENRRTAAFRAYAEWMPYREQPGGGLFRVLRFGGLADLLVLDTRHFGRDEQLSETDTRLGDEGRTLLGAAQETWLADGLRSSNATWRLLGQQVMVGQLPQRLNVDAWDGYPAARRRLFQAITGSRQGAGGNVVVLTGDIHSSWAMDLAEDPTDGAKYDPATGRGAVAVEMVTPGITSPGLNPSDEFLNTSLVSSNPHMKYVDVFRRGYLVLDVDAARVQGAWFHIDDVTSPTSGERPGGVFSVASGTNHLTRDGQAAPPKSAPPAAP